MKTVLKLTTRNKTATRDRALLALLQGEVIVIAAEHGYLYACDAFNHTAVERLHSLRGDQPGTAAQVLIGKLNAVSGLASDFDSDWQKVVGAFWPGLLTVQLSPQSALNWDLGDGRALSEFALRMPSRDFLLSVLSRSGPMAVASASPAGQPPVREISLVPVAPTEVGLGIDEGILPPGPVSTVLRSAKNSQGREGIECLREGAISLAELQLVLSSISAPKP